MKEIYNEIVGRAFLACDVSKIPPPYKFIAASDGYRFYRTDTGKYAIEE